MKEFLAEIIEGRALNEPDAAAALRQILAGDVPTAQIAAFLTAIRVRGLALTELGGFHQVLRESGKQIDVADLKPIDICGTGGDGKHTFNISTLAAFVLAGAGVPVAKHGNNSATSGCGSSDVLQFLGVRFTDDAAKLRKDLENFNICVLHAPLFQPILKSVAAIRKEIGFRTFFNYLGPLLNPTAPPSQFIGVAEPPVLRLYRDFLQDSGRRFALVHTLEGYDEISLTGAFDVVTNAGAETFLPEDLGFERIEPKALRGGETIAETAWQFVQILKNEGTRAQSQVVVANAAFAMRVAMPETDFAECRARAEESLVSGAAFSVFTQLTNKGEK